MSRCCCCLILFSRILCGPHVPSASPWPCGAGGRGFPPGFPLFLSPSARATEIVKIVHFLSPSCPSKNSLRIPLFTHNMNFPGCVKYHYLFFPLFKSALIYCFPLLLWQWSASDPAGVIYRSSCPV